jgi:hypothetical protein
MLKMHLTLLSRNIPNVMNGDQRDYWKERYEREVLGKPPPKEYPAKVVTVDEVVKNGLKFLKDKLK